MHFVSDPPPVFSNTVIARKISDFASSNLPCLDQEIACSAIVQPKSYGFLNECDLKRSR